ncbi:Cyclic pyranopterin monophosphate synthase [Stieleria neptunia]|uniref:Cyclic pyranopterin monophosphate synthase n=1 Tax=Stieleria neptunia TaxID=2527979 RepID=A0A518HU28_9BACT|nr:radical SAM protein [Stieleria neptunia]QDV44360.1 Cyclic pyranopterin monophosphate synthase [Stieleria neptunia]
MINCCKVPFETIYLHHGWGSTCCPNWYDAYDKRTDYTQEPQDVWRGAVIESHRREVASGDYSLCQRCPLVADEGMKAPIRGDWEHGPKYVHIADSMTCNLHCWSCRAGRCLSDPLADSESAERFLRRFLEHYRTTIEEVTLLNSGEVFASQRHVRLLNEFDWGTIGIGIITNATLIERKWATVQKIHGSIQRFIVSLDASNEETYSKVRLGGSWDAAVRGMELIRDLGRPLVLHYVISDKNVRDIARFADWAQRWAPERVELIPLARTYARDDWADRDVFRSGHSLNHILQTELATATTIPGVRLLS